MAPQNDRVRGFFQQTARRRNSESVLNRTRVRERHVNYEPQCGVALESTWSPEATEMARGANWSPKPLPLSLVLSLESACK